MSGAGYLGSELFSFMIPLLLLVAAIRNGAGTLAGEEERGTLELLLAHPVSRTRVASQKLAAMVTEIAGLGFVLWIALWVGAHATNMGIPAGRLAAAVADAAALALVFGSIAFLVGASTGRKAIASGLAAVTAVAAYLVNSLAALVPGLRTVQKASPYYHYAVSDPLRHGLAADHLLALMAVAAIAAGVGLVLFARRDLRA